MNILIALDIDGTITDKRHEISSEVIDYFKKLHQKGIELAFITGRSFLWGYQVLKHLPIPYYYIVQNGAFVFKMPEKKIFYKKCLNDTVFSQMDMICENEPSDYVIYTGYEKNDICYFRKEKFQPDLLCYVLKRALAIGESFQEVKVFDQSITDFASVKCFGSKESLNRIAASVKENLFLQAPVIKDPYQSNYYVLQITHEDASKGNSIKKLKEMIGFSGKVIAAGDDFNDVSMLKEADISIVMESAPQAVKDIGDIIAPSASVNGIIQGIEKALVKKRYRKE